MKRKISILICILCILLVSVSCTTPQQKPARTADPKESSLFEPARVQNVRITTDNLNCRAGTGTNFPVVDKLDKNQIVKVIGNTKDWYVVQLPDNRVGCIDSKHAEPVITEEQERNNEPQREITGVSRLNSNEERLLTLVNQERTRRNLKPLEIDLELTKVARLKSQDMVKNNYFSHYSPTYGSPFDMMKTYGIQYVSAGENIAANSSIDNAHRSLMNSEGHRRNILNPDFTHIGIGIVDSDRYGNMITQMFVSRPK